MSLIPNSTTLQELTRICREIQGRLTRLETQKSSKTIATIQEQPAAASRTAAVVSRESSVAYADSAGVAGSSKSVDWSGIKSVPDLVANLKPMNVRASVTITLGAATGTVDLGRSFIIEGEIASAAGRFRLYRTAAGRDADLGRAAGTDAPLEVGMLLEDTFTASVLAIASIPVPGAPSGGQLCAWSWSGVIGSALTLDVVILEG